MPTDDWIVFFFIETLRPNQNTICSSLHKQRAAKFWPLEENAARTLPVKEKVKLSRYKLKTTVDARSWKNIFPARHEISSSTWCMRLQVWQRAVVYDPSIDGAHLICPNCGKAMDPFDRHSIANCDTGYGRLRGITMMPGPARGGSHRERHLLPPGKYWPLLGRRWPPW